MRVCHDHEEAGFVVVFDNNIPEIDEQCPVCKMIEEMERFDYWKEKKISKKKIKCKVDIKDPPAIPAWGKFAAEKWDYEYARNALLHYVNKKGLAEDCEKWLEKNFPDERQK